MHQEIKQQANSDKAKLNMEQAEKDEMLKQIDIFKNIEARQRKKLASL